MNVLTDQKPTHKDISLFLEACIDSIHMILLDTEVNINIEPGNFNPVTEEYSGHVVYFPLTVDFNGETTFARYENIFSVDQLIKAVQHDEKVKKFADASIRSNSDEYKQFKKLKEENFKKLLDFAKNIDIGSKKLDPNDIFILKDYYEPSMFCICKGDEEFGSENDYDDRVIIPSIEEGVANSLLFMIKNTTSISKLLESTSNILNTIEHKIVSGFASDEKINTALSILERKKSTNKKIVDEYKKIVSIERARRYSKKKTSMKDPQTLAEIVTKMDSFIVDIKAKVGEKYIDKKTNKFIIKEDDNGDTSEAAVVAVLKVVEDLKNQIEECV
jgi:hypothetical protein